MLYFRGVVLNLIRQGKVRDIYSVDDEHLLIVASDRLSAYDVVFPDPIPGKGVVLTALTRWWLERTGVIVPSHWNGNDADRLRALSESAGNALPDDLADRAMIVEQCEVIPFECVVRGYAYGSYLKTHPDVKPMTPFEVPLFTPSTKAEEGHDETVSFDVMREALGETAETLRMYSLKLYQFASNICGKAGVVLVDTKFEFGRDRTGALKLIDECFTPDSSRFMVREDVERGVYESFDKQVVRDYVDRIGWDRKPPAPTLPPDVVEKTINRYRTIQERVMGVRAS